MTNADREEELALFKEYLSRCSTIPLSLEMEKLIRTMQGETTEEVYARVMRTGRAA
jgi:hypothetical protein